MLELQQTAKVVRRKAIEMIYHAGSGHPGGSLSSADILTALFCGGVLNYDHHEPKSEKRDRFILSAGHVCPAYYAVLAEAKFFDETFLSSLRDLGSFLQGHPSLLHAGFVESSTGSLGQGLSIGVGMAMGLKQKTPNPKQKVVVFSSDGEQNEGEHWEAVMFAGFHRLDNLNLIIDQNGMQIGGSTAEVLDTEPLADKYLSFGWDVFQVDGHDFNSLLSNFSRFNDTRRKPKLVIAKTIRGKGVSFMEGEERYHACTLSEEEYKKAQEELA